ncbi:unnamed protein product [Lactuca virosa]|uniref:Uncharacterized protein n=1 Tax=Lactuca virosa TaxID=75947 RepID=A0AAU9M120_9ASTR|nr:unnamed protein product [Lactuca virosa]
MMVWRLEVFSTNQRFPLLLPAQCDSCFDRLVFLINFVFKTTISGNQINDFTCRKNKGEAENTDSTTPGNQQRIPALMMVVVAGGGGFYFFGNGYGFLE